MQHLQVFKASVRRLLWESGISSDRCVHVLLNSSADYAGASEPERKQ